MQELGYPWVMRKIMVKYGSKATDVVQHKDSLIRITTVNAKASWTRDYLEGKDVYQVRLLP